MYAFVFDQVDLEFQFLYKNYTFEAMCLIGSIDKRIKILYCNVINKQTTKFLDITNIKNLQNYYRKSYMKIPLLCTSNLIVFALYVNLLRWQLVARTITSDQTVYNNSSLSF